MSVFGTKDRISSAAFKLGVWWLAGLEIQYQWEILGLALLTAAKIKQEHLDCSNRLNKDHIRYAYKVRQSHTPLIMQKMHLQAIRGGICII